MINASGVECQWYVGGGISEFRNNSSHPIKFKTGGYQSPYTMTIETDSNLTVHTNLNANSVITNSLTVGNSTPTYPLNTHNVSSNWTVAKFKQEFDNAGVFVNLERSGTNDYWNLGVYNNNGFSFG